MVMTKKMKENVTRLAETANQITAAESRVGQLQATWKGIARHCPYFLTGATPTCAHEDATNEFCYFNLCPLIKTTYIPKKVERNTKHGHS
jgi:hypothetical protein